MKENIFDKYLEALEESISEQLSFEDSMYGNREDDYYNWFYSIEEMISEYKDRLPLEEFLISRDKFGEIYIEDAIMDIHNALESIIEDHHIREELMGIIGEDKTQHLDSLGKKYINALKKSGYEIKDLNLIKHKESIVDAESFNNSLSEIIAEKNVDKIKHNFNETTLSINQTFLAFKKVINNEIKHQHSDVVKNRHSGSISGFWCKDILNKPLDLSKRAQACIERYTEYSPLFKKAAKLDHDTVLEKRFKLEDCKSIEEITDEMNEVIIRSQIKSSARKYLGRHINLLDEEGVELINEINSQKVSDEVIRGELKNIIALKNSGDLNLSLRKIIEINKGGIEKTIHEAKSGNYNCTTLYEDRHHFAISLDDYESSRKFSSNRWCISHSKSHYDSYKKLNGKNIIIFQKNEDPTSETYRIGITINEDGELTHAFNNRNKSVLSSLTQGQIIPARVLNAAQEPREKPNSPSSSRNRLNR